MKGYQFFTNSNCEYYPCHDGVKDNAINCLFCFCPLYALGDRCGGTFSYTKDGVKDCSGCILPHTAEGYDYIVDKCGELIEMVKRGKDSNEK